MAHRSVRSFFECHMARAGYGPQKLATLAAYALRRNLLDWLETFKVEKLCAARLAKQREAAKVCPLPAQLWLSLHSTRSPEVYCTANLQ